MYYFGYLMHLVGYLYEDYHDARSLENKVSCVFCIKVLTFLGCDLL
jgi:hypothetical protein